MTVFSRRQFIRTSSAALIGTALTSTSTSYSQTNKESQHSETHNERMHSASRDIQNKKIQMLYDGVALTPFEYSSLLTQLTENNGEVKDTYGKGGAVEALEKKFIQLTGKESALFMPSGTLANQLAISYLSNGSSKVITQDISHIFRDEQDALQTLHGKRVLALGKGCANFTVDDVKSAIDHYRENEVFDTNVGVIAIENPVRRSNGQLFDLDQIQKIAQFAKANKINMHLDGARLLIATTYSGISVKQYSSYFDSIYLSLYKYLGAGSGAILCGDKKMIESMDKSLKIYGAKMYQNWQHAVVALHFLEGFELRIKNAKQRAQSLFETLNQIPGLSIENIPFGTNIVKLNFSQFNYSKFIDRLHSQHSIQLPKAKKNNDFVYLKVNETLLNQPINIIQNAIHQTAAYLFQN